ncbi:beta-eliminating lyase-related protein [Marinomonas rhodophyticola]|uniref:Beta-eliminating lyase-related protein n=1 Tax=Marinomonas rhodophyticola TaxID=2992803 RepID=A0ABT3KHL1_9GAMM|nr:beta-eliminating lyase-related protein [Marinomonas sp. KJ51-3]MCW4630040.1 beta-eliminating lyase-related protein [Marinomonas sp. KJ51-3]
MTCAFFSDNMAGASEAVFKAMMEAAQGDAMPYGGDDGTAQVTRMLSDFLNAMWMFFWYRLERRRTC